MSPAEVNTNIVNGYVELLDNLSLTGKLDLISKLTNFAKRDLKKKSNSFKKAYGAFESDKSAEEMIEDLRKNRIFNRQTESF
jgi:hypothetical protein